MAAFKQGTKKVIGVILVIVGLLGIITPLTPWGFLFFVGLELLGLRLVFQEKMKHYLTRVKQWFKKKQPNSDEV